MAMRTATVMAIAFTLTKWQIPTPHFSEEKIEGLAEFHIESLKIQPSPFHRSLLYKGTLTTFTTEEGVSHDLPCSLYMPLRKNRPLADQDYKIAGTLIAKDGRRYLLKPDKKKVWEPIAKTWSLAEWRFQAKEKVCAFLKKEIPSPKSASFLSALATGDIDERALTLEFSRLGIQHILAISGFHFALMAAFFSFFLRLFLKPKHAAVLLLILLTGYFFFIGNGPSVARAWIAISLFLIAQIKELRMTGLNALGMGLIVEILCDPMLILHIGFQLSFLATLSILLVYPAMNKLAWNLLPRRPIDNLAGMRRFSQHIYLIGATLRQSISLNLAVHLATVPLLLFLFHKFPILSLGYNLFIPLGASLSLLLLCTSLLGNLLVPPLGHLLHQINSAFTAALLKTAEHPPAIFDFSLRLKPFPLAVLLAFLTLLFYAAVSINRRQTEA